MAAAEPEGGSRQERPDIHLLIRFGVVVIIVLALGRALFHLLIFTEQIVRLAQGAIR